MEFKVLHLKKKYHNNIIIRDFSYVFQSGLYLVLGKNGAGKSTLAKMIAKLVRPSNKDYQMTKIDLCYLNEKVELSNGLPLDYLKDIAILNGSHANIKDLIKMYNIPNKDMYSLSKGNKQKVAILMAYLQDASLYIFDEVTDALDKASLDLLKEYIKHLIYRDKIILVITHEPSYFKDFTYTELRL